MTLGTRLFTRLLIASALLLTLIACEQRSADTTAPVRQPEPLTFGVPLQPTSSLALVAWKEGYFAAEGLKINILSYPSGKLAVKGMLAGECDLATTTTIPMVIASFETRDFRILTSLANSRDMFRIVARSDLGIKGPADLRGKRIATQKGSAVHFFLHLFLLQQNLSESDIELSFLPAVELPAALARGEIDAFCMREPFVSQSRELLGDRVSVFSAPGLYDAYELLVARRDFVEQFPASLIRVLRALRQAEAFCQDHPAQAQQVVAEALAVPVESIRQLWPGINLELFLPQSLLANLESEAVWAAPLTQGEPPTNFLDFIWPDALLRAKPGSMSIIAVERP